MQISSNDLSSLGLFSGSAPALPVTPAPSSQGKPVRWLLVGTRTQALLESLAIRVVREYPHPLILAGTPAFSEPTQREILKAARRSKTAPAVSGTLRTALTLPTLMQSSLVLAGNLIPDVSARVVLAAVPMSGAPVTPAHLATFDEVFLGPAASWEDAALLAGIAAQWHLSVNAAFFMTLRPGYALALRGLAPHRYAQVAEAITGNVPNFID